MPISAHMLKSEAKNRRERNHLPNKVPRGPREAFNGRSPAFQDGSIDEENKASLRQEAQGQQHAFSEEKLAGRGYFSAN